MRVINQPAEGFNRSLLGLWELYLHDTMPTLKSSLPPDFSSPSELTSWVLHMALALSVTQAATLSAVAFDRVGAPTIGSVHSIRLLP